MTNYANYPQKGPFDQTLVGEQYYHGLLPREDIRTMLKVNGDFLVRTSEPKQDTGRAYILSVMFNEKKSEEGIKHFVIRSTNHKWSIEKYSFDTIPMMIQHHVRNKDSVSTHAEVFLIRAVNRQKWELQHEDITLTKKLGEGAFGEVHKGILRLKKSNQTVDVAVKLAKLEQLTKEQIKEIMREARLMRMFDHINVVKFYGVAAGQEPLMVLMELADCGALDSYLKKSVQPVEKKIEYSVQSSWGIEYLHAKKVIHRDIAARNCLFGGGNVKISDFGLTREGTIYQMDPSKRVPIRWLAPETMRQFCYTQLTDVWAYGIMVWEIFANGQEPYPGMSPGETFVKVRNEQYRMPMPVTTPQFITDLVTKRCWAESPNDRWSMAQISHSLEQLTKMKRPPSQIGSVLKSAMKRNAINNNNKKK